MKNHFSARTQRNKRALAQTHCRYTVRSLMPSDCATSSLVNPPKNFKPVLPDDGNTVKPILPNNGLQLKPICGAGQEMVHGQCMPKCSGDQFRARNGACVDKTNGNDNGPPPRMQKIQ